MLPSLRIRRSSWRDLFIARELEYFPSGPDRYLLLIVKALASCLGTFIISVGPVASLIIKSQGFGVSGYGYIVGGCGLAGAFIALVSANAADRFSRIRVMLWAMIVPIVLLFALSLTPDRQPVVFAVLYLLMAGSEACAVVTVSALLRDLSPRTGRALGVGLVTVGTLSANWGSAFFAGQSLGQAGSWQNMLRLFGFVCVGLWLVVWLFGREPSRGIRAQILPSMKAREAVEAKAKVLEREGIRVGGFWAFIRADWRLWLLAFGQGAFLLGYITFVYYGPVLTQLGFGQSPQQASATTSWAFLSIIVFLIVGGVVSDWLRIRKTLGVVFTTISGFALIGLGFGMGTHIDSRAVAWIYVGVGAVMAMMWSPTNALFSENAEDINASRQTTAFGGQQLINRAIYQSWIFVLPLVLALGGQAGPRIVWFIAGAGALITAPILIACRGSWGRSPVLEVETADRPVAAVVDTPTEPAT